MENPLSSIDVQLVLLQFSAIVLTVHSVVFCLYFVIFLLLYDTDSIICGQFIFLLGRPVSEL